MQRGVATFTLDYGRCPRWLFERMVRLGGQISEILIAEFGPDEFIRRLADPVWFQSLGTVLAFDWNASGLTTILTAALKEAMRGREKEFGVFICGGKGRTSRKTPDEIALWGERLALPKNFSDNLVYNSKMSAKVDSALIQDGYQIYHHSFFFSAPKNGKSAWAVVQQGMNTGTQTARRYHWFSENVRDLVEEPHSAIVSQLINKAQGTLDLSSKKSRKNREVAVELTRSGGYQTLMRDIEILRKHSSELGRMISLKSGQERFTALELANREFHSHPMLNEDFSKSKYLEKVLSHVVEVGPNSYEKFLAIRGVGSKTVRALALVGEVLYGAQPSYEDPARYSFAHGGKDATPYPVDRKTYDSTIAILRHAVLKSRMSLREKNEAITKLNR